MLAYVIELDRQTEYAVVDIGEQAPMTVCSAQI